MSLQSRPVLRPALFVLLLAATAPAVAQPETSTVRGILVREAELYVAPDARSQRLGSVTRGRDVPILDQSTLDGRNWLKVLAPVEQSRNVTGWLLDKGVVRSGSANGDRIVFGEAVDSEAEASKRRGRKGAEMDALRLYYRVFEYWPQSPLAGEALYRAADVRWQVEKAEVMSRPSAREADPGMRQKINEEWIRELHKKFKGTKWAALGAYLTLDNKLCGDWQGQARCPERESNLYEEYVRNYPESPKAPEALYEAARRQAALVDIYLTNEDSKKSQAARQKALGLTQRLASQYPNTDWSHRALRLGYLLEQEIPTYGRTNE